MSVSFEFEAKQRVASGKSAARRLRSEDRVPAIVYGTDKAPMPISLSHNKVIKTLAHEAVYSHILTLNIEGVEAEKVVLKAISRHPVKPKIVHMDFLRINTKEKITMRVPLHFVGEDKSPGLKEEGVLSKLITHLDVSCLPLNLPEYIEVDISNLGMGEALHLSQIVMPKEVVFAHAITDEEHDQAIVHIHQPRAAEEELTTAPVAAETVITGQKAPEEEGAGESTDAGGKKPEPKKKD